jgi:MFS family permease
VTGYLIAYAFGQLVFGPHGRCLRPQARPRLGLSLFTLGCVLSLAAPTSETFVAARVLQGFGIATTNLLAKAIITDSFSGQALVHAFTYMAIAWGLAPIVAPVIGAHLQEAFGWRSCLVFLLVYSFAMWAMLWRIARPGRPVHLHPAPCSRMRAWCWRARCSRAASWRQGLCYSILLVFNIVGPFMVQNTCTSRRPSSAIWRWPSA